MIVDTKIYKYEVPESKFDSGLERFEYLLQWIGTDGGLYQWMFYDFERKTEIDGTVINTKSTQNIGKLFKSAFQTVTLYAEDLNFSEVTAIENMLRSKTLQRVFKDGSINNLAVKSDSISIKQTDSRYTVELEVYEVEKPILK